MVRSSMAEQERGVCVFIPAFGYFVPSTTTTQHSQYIVRLTLLSTRLNCALFIYLQCRLDRGAYLIWQKLSIRLKIV